MHKTGSSLTPIQSKAMEANKQLKLKIKLPTRVQPEVMPQPGEVGIYTNKIHYLRKYLLDELASKKFAMDFMEPVDTTALQVPNYYTVIKSPMDVGTIIKRVQNRYYQRADDLIRDFQLVISNCFQFNRPSDVVYRNCLKLEKFFHRVLSKMPKGDEKPSTKDPRSTSKQLSCERNVVLVQRQCQEHLRKLRETIAQEEDKSICKYFNTKIEYLSQKVDRLQFKTIEEFRFEVASIFKNFDNQIITLHEAFHKTCNADPLQRYANCHWGQENEVKNIEEEREPVKLDKRDVTDVIHALKRAENSVDHCMKSYSRQRENCARNLINVFDISASKLKEKLMRGRTAHTSREYRQLVLAEKAESEKACPGLTIDENSLKEQDGAAFYSHGGKFGGELVNLGLGSSQEPENVEYQDLGGTTVRQKQATTNALSKPSRSCHYPQGASLSTALSKNYETFESYHTPMAAPYPEIDVVAVDDADTAAGLTTAVSEGVCNRTSGADGRSGANADSAELAFGSAKAAYSVFTAVPGFAPPGEYCGSLPPVTFSGTNNDCAAATAADSDSESTSGTSTDFDSDSVMLEDFDYASVPVTGADSNADAKCAFASGTPADPESIAPRAAAAALNWNFDAVDKAPDRDPASPAAKVHASTPSNTSTTNFPTNTGAVFNSMLWSDLHLSSSDESD